MHFGKALLFRAFEHYQQANYNKVPIWLACQPKPWRRMERIEMLKIPRVGVAVIVQKEGKVLLGERQSALGAGKWAFPGGHLEFNETVEACAEREVFEETGLQIQDIKYAAFTNDIFKDEDKHYITLYVIAEYAGGELELKEPDKCSQWAWFSWESLPEPRFLPLENLLKQGFKV